jgi:hypothetical protein
MIQNKQRNATFWRWVASAAVLINIFFNYYLNANPINGQTIGNVSDKYPTLITPAGYAFSIWGIIYLSFIIYGIYQLLPSQQNKQIYNRLAWPLIATSLLSILWLISFSFEQLALSVFLIACMLVTAIFLFGWARRAALEHKASVWISVPFGLYLGWLSVATITNIAVRLTDMGWQGGTLEETTWTIIMIGAALAAGLLISYIFREITYPLVIAWATIAIFIARQDANKAVAYAALITAITMIIWVIGFGFRLYKKSQLQNAWQHS